MLLTVNSDWVLGLDVPIELQSLWFIVPMAAAFESELAPARTSVYLDQRTRPTPRERVDASSRKRHQQKEDDAGETVSLPRERACSDALAPRAEECRDTRGQRRVSKAAASDLNGFSRSRLTMNRYTDRYIGIPIGAGSP